MPKLLSILLLLTVYTGSKVKPVNLEQLNSATLKNDNDTLYVVNFWATWCKPCVHEMPYFDKANAVFEDHKVKVVFVSLNSIKELPQVQQFINDKQFSEDIFLLNAGNPNDWIDKIDPSWSGAIPATIMYRKGKKVLFHEGDFTPTQLDSIIKTKIQ